MIPALTHVTRHVLRHPFIPSSFVRDRMGKERPCSSIAAHQHGSAWSATYIPEKSAATKVLMAHWSGFLALCGTLGARADTENLHQLRKRVCVWLSSSISFPVGCFARLGAECGISRASSLLEHVLTHDVLVTHNCRLSLVSCGTGPVSRIDLKPADQNPSSLVPGPTFEANTPRVLS